MTILASLARDHARAYDPDHASDAPRDEHDSHAWETLPRWRECSACGARDYWPAGALRCERRDLAREERIALSDALTTILADLAAFEAWWLARRAALGTERPSFAEWRAEFFEWSRAGGASR